MALVPVAQASLAWMIPGEHVQIQGIFASDTSKEAQTRHYESMMWTIVEAPREGFAILCDTMDMAGTEDVHLIRVNVAKVSPANLQFSGMQFDVPFHWKFESWIMETSSK